MLVEGYSVQFLLLGFEQWLKEKALYKGNKQEQKPRTVGSGTTLSDWKDNVSDLAKCASIEIPSDATVKIQPKNGYDQITFKWLENGYNYEVRWHTKTPGAPAGKGNSWVVARVTPGTPLVQVRVEHILVGDKWIPRYL